MPPMSAAKMPENVAESRKNDAVIIVLQSNQDQSFIIHQMNSSAEDMLGFETGEMVGRRFETILAPRLAELLADEIEFYDDAPDLGDVLAKQREVRLRHQSGQELPVECKISRQMAVGSSACFRLAIPNEKEKLGQKKIREFLSLNLDGRKQLDEVLGVPNRATAEAFIPLLENYLAESGIEASLAILRLDRYEKSLGRYGKSGCVVQLQHMVNCCRSSFRSDDIVFVLGDNTLGVILFDISRESARLVFNRLRWKIRNHHIEFGGKSNFSVTTTIVFDMIGADRTTPLLAREEEAVAGLLADERNGLVELGAA